MTTEQKTTKAPPDRSKETKLAKALDALNSAATAYFNEGDTDTALALREHRDEIEKFKAKE